MKIFLVGFMGCGKTTMGKQLARKLGFAFVDLDHVVEERTGSTVAAYFAAHGEAGFRELESKTLKTYTYPENCVVATGGGTPCFFDNMDWMNAHGLTVYFSLSPKALAKRLESGKHTRPLLKDLDEMQMESFIREKLSERSLFYENAALIVEGLNLTADALFHLLIDRIGSRADYPEQHEQQQHNDRQPEL